jgi:hypothetical protein
VIECSTYARSVDDLLSVNSEYFMGHGMTDVFTDANKMSLGYSGCRGEWIIVYFVEYFFPPVETEEWADIVSGSSKACHRYIAMGAAYSMVEDEADV